MCAHARAFLLKKIVFEVLNKLAGPHFSSICSRNGNGSGLGRVFPYPNPTHGARPGPFRVPGFFPAPGLAPVEPRLGLGPNSWPNQKKKKNFKPRFIFSLRSSLDLFLIYFCRSSLHIPNKKIKPKFIFAYIQTCIFKFKPK